MTTSAVRTLWRVCVSFRRRRQTGARLPPLLFFTDPVRTPDPVAVAARLPRGAGVVFRAFGAADALVTGRRLARVARRRGLLLLVGADPALAVALGADGLHLPERRSDRAGFNRALARRFLVTAAAHSLPAILRARAAGVQAVVVSPVFPSRSPSAGRPIGPRVLAHWARRAGLPVYALGGVGPHTVRRLASAGVIGAAAIEGLLDADRKERASGEASSPNRVAAVRT